MAAEKLLSISEIHKEIKNPGNQLTYADATNELMLRGIKHVPSIPIYDKAIADLHNEIDKLIAERLANGNPAPQKRQQGLPVMMVVMILLALLFVAFAIYLAVL